MLQPQEREQVIPLNVLTKPGARRRVMTLRSPEGELLGYFPRKRIEAAIAGLTTYTAIAVVRPERAWIEVKGKVNHRVVCSHTKILPMKTEEAHKLLEADAEKEAVRSELAKVQLSNKGVLFQPRNIKNEYLEPRKAWPVTIPGFEDISFVVHKMNTGWGVSEVTTGMSTGIAATKVDAIAESTRRLNTIGLEKAKVIVADALAKLVTYTEAADGD